MYSIIMLLLFALALSVISAIIFLSIAEKIGIMDVPGGRKIHQNKTPLVGGIIIFSGCLAFPFFKFDSNWIPLYCMLFSTLALGLADDIYDLSAYFRLLFQLITGYLLVKLLNLKIEHLGNLFGFGEVVLGVLSTGLICFATAAAKNALNMIDGVDGLAGSLALLPVGILFFIFLRNNALELANFSITIIGGLLVFLFLNFPFPGRKSAACFLGDSGSTLLGLIVVYLLISASSMGLIKPIMALYLFAMPLIDSAGVIIRRLIRGAAVSKAGRDHFHHILIDEGLSARQTSMFIFSKGVVIAVFGIILDHRNTPESVLFYLFLSLIFFNLVLIKYFKPIIRSIINFFKITLPR